MPEVVETHQSRENRVVEVVARVFPDLVLTSRMQTTFASGLRPRLRYELPSEPLGCVSTFFGSKSDSDERLAFTIARPGNQPLSFEKDWHEMDVHLFRPELLERAKTLAGELEALSSKQVRVVLEE